MAKRLGYLLFLCLFFTFTAVFGQEAAQQNTETGPVNEFFRSESKIYVAVGVLTIIFTCIVLYLIRLDRRISKLEKE